MITVIIQQNIFRTGLKLIAVLKIGFKSTLICVNSEIVVSDYRFSKKIIANSVNYHCSQKIIKPIFGIPVLLK